MNLNSPDTWRWIWIVMAIVFATGELVTPATFFFLPFAIGAAVAAALSFAGVDPIIAFPVFLIVSSVAFASLWKLGRKLERLDEEQEGVGATRWIGQEALVTKTIEAGGMGRIRLEREDWRAESLTGAQIRKGSTVLITRLAGTRLVVVPVDEPPEDLSLPDPDQFHRNQFLERHALMPFIILLAFIFIVLFAFAASGVKIIRPYERGLVERLGRYKATVNPGLRIIFPFFEKVIRVDMRERVIDVPPQEVITEDNVVVSVDAVVFYEATDPRRLVYNVANFLVAVTKLAQTNLRNVVGDMQLDEALTSREIINARLRDILDDATDKWGTKVVRVEIQRIDPPPDVVDAMHHQMKAERTRRAVVTEAQGSREAAVTRATGEKQAAILSAEGRRQSQILEAEGQAEATRAVADAERFRRITVAEGEAEATKLVYLAIHEGGPTNDLIAIKYLEALQKMADGQATKIVVPVESSGFTGALAGMAAMLKGDDNNSGNSGGGGGPGGFPPNPFDYRAPNY